MCNGGTSTISVAAGGGTPAYQYSLNGGANQVSNVFTNLVAGSYTIVVTDANNCTTSTTLTITEPTLLTATATSTAVLCFGGTADITVTANGGTPAYQYSINGGANQASNVFTNLIAGSYTIVVTDANNCTTSTTLTITEPTLLTATATSTAVLCFGGTADITVTANGGTPAYQYRLRR